jgi:hypothetical protein
MLSPIHWAYSDRFIASIAFCSSPQLFKTGGSLQTQTRAIFVGSRHHGAIYHACTTLTASSH